MNRALVTVWGEKAGVLRTGNICRTDSGEGPTRKEEQKRVESGGGKMEGRRERPGQCPREQSCPR